MTPALIQRNESRMPTSGIARAITSLGDFLKARAKSIRCVKQRFDEARIEVPEPIHRIHMLRPGERLDQRPGPSPGPKREGSGTTKTSADRTIERQIAEVERAQTEKDLLKSQLRRGRPILTHRNPRQ